MSKERIRGLILVGVLVALLAVAVACGDDDDDGDGAETNGEVTLQEWSVNPDRASGPAGWFEFVVENIGPDDEHEFKERATVDASNGPWQYRTMPILPRRYIRGAKREMQVPTNAPRPRQQSLPWSVTLHLAPGAIFTLALVLGTAAGIEPALALFAGIGVVLVPLELGYLSFQSHRTTGSWSPLGVVDYRDRLPTRKLSLLAGGLAAWFLVVLVLSIAFLDQWLADNVFGWMPESLLEFARVENDEEGAGTLAVVAIALIALAFNGIAGPITEELYFRGYLLPGIERYGRAAPVLNTVLFAVYHFFSPWRYPAIIIGFLPITWAAWRRRSIYVSMVAHMAINLITVLLIVAALAAES